LIELRLSRSIEEEKQDRVPDDLPKKTKALMKDQIDKVETLDQEDLDTLITMLKSLRQNYGSHK
jgi:hypothetical protein